jgi:hypothetical protein
MCELKSCLCDEGVSDVKFSCEDSGWDIADARVGGCDGSSRSRFLLRSGWRCKGRSLGEGDWLSPKALFVWGKRWGLTVWSVGDRLAPGTTASLCGGHVGVRGRCFNLARFRERSGCDDWGVPGVGRWEHLPEAGSGGLVFWEGASAVHADFGFGAGTSTAIVFSGLLGVLRVGEEWATKVLGNSRESVIGAGEAALAFYFFVWARGGVGGVLGGGRAGISRLEASIGVVAGGGRFWEIAPEVFEVRTEFFDGHGFGHSVHGGKAEFEVVAEIWWQDLEEASGGDSGTDASGFRDVFADLSKMIFFRSGFIVVEELVDVGSGDETGLVPFDLGFFEEVIILEFFVKSGEEFCGGFFPSGADKIGDAPGFRGNFGGVGSEGLKNAFEGLSELMRLGAAVGTEESLELGSISFVFLGVWELRDFANLEEAFTGGLNNGGGGRGSAGLFAELFDEAEVFVPIIVREVAEGDVELMGVYASDLGKSFHQFNRVRGSSGAVDARRDGDLIPKSGTLFGGEFSTGPHAWGGLLVPCGLLAGGGFSGVGHGS